MRIRMLSTAAGPQGVFKGGAEYAVPGEISEQLASGFLKGRAAVEVKEDAKPKQGPAKVETAAAAPVAETATDKTVQAAAPAPEKERQPAHRAKGR